MVNFPVTSRDWIEALVAFDTTSALSNLALIEFVEAYLLSLGVPFSRSRGNNETKANLYASVGPPVAGGVVLSGHSDVVPVEGQAWSSDPFIVEERGGNLYGRGTADMKSFLAVALALLPEFQRHDLKRPIHIAISHDEEIGCLGVPSLIEQMMDEHQQPALVIVGEPTSMRVVNAHKGVWAFETHIRGRPAHSSQLGNQERSGIDETGDEHHQKKHDNGPFGPHHQIHNGQQVLMMQII